MGVWVGGRGTGMNWEVGMDMYTLSCVLTRIHYHVYENVHTTMCMDMYTLRCVKEIASENLLSSTGSSAWCSVVT